MNDFRLFMLHVAKKINASFLKLERDRIFLLPPPADGETRPYRPIASFGEAATGHPTRPPRRRTTTSSTNPSPSIGTTTRPPPPAGTLLETGVTQPLGQSIPAKQLAGSQPAAFFKPQPPRQSPLGKKGVMRGPQPSLTSQHLFARRCPESRLGGPRETLVPADGGPR